MHARQIQALDEIPRIAEDFRTAFGRDSGGLVTTHRTEDADTVVVALGSMLGGLEDVVDSLRVEGVRIGVLGITCFRPWPGAEVREALSHAKRVVVVEKAFAVGAGGIVGQNTRLALGRLPVTVYDVVAGLGGRPVTRASLRGLVEDVLADRLDAQALHFLDLDTGLVARELARTGEGGTGPHAEHMLRALGTTGSASH
jgi:pyruvate ferredoxin oxidoreductase alpha subunit